MNNEPHSSESDPRLGEQPSSSSILPPAEFDSGIVEADLVQRSAFRKPGSKLRFSGVVSWFVVLVITGLLVTLVAYQQFFKSDQIGGDATPMDLMPIQMQGKLVVAQNSLSGVQGSASTSVLPPSMNSGPYEQRLCYSILLNEVQGPDAAIEHLDDTDQAVADSNLTLTEYQTQLGGIVRSLMDQYRQGDMDSRFLEPSQRELLESKLQWVGKLALLPKSTPQTEARAQLVSEANGLLTTGVFAVLLAACFGFAGSMLAVLFVVLLYNRKLKSGFATGTTDLNVYIETFAIWMTLFFGGSILPGYLGVRSPESSIAITPLIFFGSLISLAWPLFRGISFSQVRADIGWTAKNPLKEAATSLPFYLATATFLIPSVIVVTILMSIISGLQDSHEFARPNVPSHPIQEYLSEGNATMIFFVFVTACVAAPIVEETMFRGVLYRHLRELTSGWRRWMSVLGAALFNGLIFASIHPQGLMGIPLLTTLAIGFSLAREWRGSLVCPMVMHGIHNALVTCVVLLIL